LFQIYKYVLKEKGVFNSEVRIMKTQITILIVFVCILATFCTTYVVVNGLKDQEIKELTARYEENISLLNFRINSSDYNLQYSGYQLEKYTNYTNNLINQLPRNVSAEMRFNETQWFTIGNYSFWSVQRNFGGISFSENGDFFPGYVTGLLWNWNIKSNLLIIYTSWTIQGIFNYSFSNNATTLTLRDITNGKTVVYIKQNTKESERFIGTWNVSYKNQPHHNIWSLNNNSNVYFSNNSGFSKDYWIEGIYTYTWYLIDTHLVIYYGPQIDSTYSYTFSYNDSILTLINIDNGATVILTR